MPEIRIDPLRDAPGGAVSATIEFTAQAYRGGAPAIRMSGDEVIFPVLIKITVEDETLIDLEELPADCYWKVRVVGARHADTRTITFPAGSGPFDYEDLVDIDPETVLPDAGTALADAYLEALEAVRDDTVAAHDETEDMLDDTFVNVEIDGENLVFTTHGGEEIVIGPIGGGEGSGAVATVNGVAPDLSGDVELTPADIGAQPAGSYATSSDLTTGLSGKANTSHTHTISNVTGLQAALDGKVDDAEIAALVSDDELADAIADVNTAISLKYTKPGAGIPITDFTAAVQDALGLASSASQPGHTHAQSDVTGLSASLSGKANTSHTHAQSDVTGLSGALAAKADLVGGVVPTAQIPAIAITEYKGVKANQAAMLATTGEQGDWVIRSDQQTSWIITGNDPTQLSSWTEMAYPAASSAVSSVNSQTGTVVLGYADVGAAAASHTHAQSDVTGLSAALTAKADDSAVVKLTGSQTVAGVKTFSSSPVVPDSSFTIAKTTGLQTAIDGKAATSHTHTASQISDSTTTGRAVVMAADAAAARSAIAAAYTGDLDNVFTIASAAIPASEKGANNGVATLGSDGKVPSGQLPPASAPLNAAIGTVAPTALGEYFWIETDGDGNFIDMHVGENT